MARAEVTEGSDPGLANSGSCLQSCGFCAMWHAKALCGTEDNRGVSPLHEPARAPARLIASHRTASPCKPHCSLLPVLAHRAFTAASAYDLALTSGPIKSDYVVPAIFIVFSNLPWLPLKGTQSSIFFYPTLHLKKKNGKQKHSNSSLKHQHEDDVCSLRHMPRPCSVCVLATDPPTCGTTVITVSAQR